MPIVQFSFGLKEQLMVMLQNVNDGNKRAHPHYSGIKRMCDSTKHNGLITTDFYSFLKRSQHFCCCFVLCFGLKF